MRIGYDLGFVFHPGASDEENAEVLRLSLDYLINVNRVWRRNRRSAPALYDSGVRYDRTQVWDSTPDLYARTYGDCKSLTATRIAELREDGIPASPCFRHLHLRDPNTGKQWTEYHILVQLEGVRSGLFGGRKIVAEDPSLKCGMKEYYAARGLQFLGVQ